MLIISNVSVEKYISLTHIRREYKIIMKTIYYVMNITFTAVNYLKHKVSHILLLLPILF